MYENISSFFFTNVILLFLQKKINLLQSERQENGHKLMSHITVRRQKWFKKNKQKNYNYYTVQLSSHTSIRKESLS